MPKPALSSKLDDDRNLNGGQRNEMRMISRAAEVLRALCEQPTGMSLGQIAKATGLARSTVQRLVKALETEGFVQANADGVGVRLGIELARLGAKVHSDVRGLFRPHVLALQDKVQATIDVTVLMEAGAVVIEQIASSATLRVVSYLGQPLPIHCTASGKAHLMQLDAERAVRALARPLKRFTPATITNPRDLADLADTANAGEFAYDREEYAIGVFAIALPIRGIATGNYAVAVSMPEQQFNGRIPFLRRELRRCQAAIESAASF